MVNSRKTVGKLEAILEVVELTKEYSLGGGLFRNETLCAVDRVSFTLKSDQTLALVGESGSGKSTVGRCLLHLTLATRGIVRLRGREIQNLSEREFRSVRKRIQMVFQNPLGSFNPRMKIGEALREPLALRDDLEEVHYHDEVVELLEQVGLSERFVDRYPSQMSGGQLQRVGVARALAPQPDLIFLDEPTSALDMSIRGQIVNLLLDQQAKFDLSYILVTHDLRVVRFMADEVAVMYLGQFVEVASKSEIFRRPLHPYTRGLFAAVLLGEDERRERRRLFQLRGEVLRLEPDYQGCRLIRRCPFARDKCKNEQRLREVGPQHWVRCWRAEEIEQELANADVSLKEGVPI
jgi:oligopeptide/dipeptide ABC transporter ATP-binding protein